MNMMEAVKSVYSNYAKFSGRARRAEYWWFYLFYLIVYLVLGVVDSLLFGTTTTENGFSASTDTPILSGIFALGSLIPNLAVGVRRLHDINRRGWWLLIALIPLVGIIILIVWLAKAGDKGPNQYGGDPISGEGEGPAEPSYSETSIPKV